MLKCTDPFRGTRASRPAGHRRPSKIRGDRGHGALPGRRHLIVWPASSPAMWSSISAYAVRSSLTAACGTARGTDTPVRSCGTRLTVRGDCRDGARGY